MSDRVPVSEFGEIRAANPRLTIPEASQVADELSEADAPVLVLAKWLAPKKEIVPIEGRQRIYRASIINESDDAWEVVTGQESDWIPKSQGTMFVRESGVDEISRPASTLSDFGGTA